jgi:hypothetical protein
LALDGVGRSVGFTLFGLLDLPFQMPELLFPFAFLLGDVAWREEKGPSRAPIASTAVDWLVLGAIALSVLWPPFRALPWAVLAVVVFSSAALSRGTVGVPAWVFLGGSFFAARALLSPSASGASRFFAIVGLVVAFSLYLWSHPEPRRFLSRFLAGGRPSVRLDVGPIVQGAPRSRALDGVPEPEALRRFRAFSGAGLYHPSPGEVAIRRLGVGDGDLDPFEGPGGVVGHGPGLGVPLEAPEPLEIDRGRGLDRRGSPCRPFDGWERDAVGSIEDLEGGGALRRGKPDLGERPGCFLPKVPSDQRAGGFRADTCDVGRA